tara:strand:- start:1792 stop:2040 length:249 start_codon:yes stop_codon:yes gene_type:complete
MPIFELRNWSLDFLVPFWSSKKNGKTIFGVPTKLGASIKKCISLINPYYQEIALPAFEVLEKRSSTNNFEQKKKPLNYCLEA